jgi:hypothetical protein
MKELPNDTAQQVLANVPRAVPALQHAMHLATRKHVSSTFTVTVTVARFDGIANGSGLLGNN